jgi:hypothetical protein
MPSVITEEQQWSDQATNTLIVNGKIYIGIDGLDPAVLANQLTLYSDRDLTPGMEIPNPQDTNESGRSVNKIWFAESQYSIAVTNSAAVVKYSELNNGDDALTVNTLTVTTATVNTLTVTTAEIATLNDIPVTDYGITLDSMAAMVAEANTSTKHDSFTIKSFHDGDDKGGGGFYRDPTRDTADHNGITVIDWRNTANLGLWTPAEQAIWFAAVGGNTGCLIRAHQFPVNALWAGVKLGGTDSTIPLQAWIDFVLSTYTQTALAPAGKYTFTTLDFTDSSGGSRATRGKIRLLGEGQLARADVFGQHTDEYGTIFESSLTTSENAFTFGNASIASAIQLENLTVVYGGTGYAVHIDFCPEFEMTKTSIRCTANGSKALFLQDVWHGVLTRCIIMPDISLTSTVAGVTFDASTFAGSLKFENCIIDKFNDCVHLLPSTNFVNITFDNTSIQKYLRYGLFVEGPVWNLALNNCYMETFETAAISPIKIAPTTANVNNFIVDGLFVLGGTIGASGGFITGPAIDLADVTTYSIKNVKYFRPWTPFLNVDANSHGVVSGINIQHDDVANLPTGPLYLFTGDANTEFSISNIDMSVSSKLVLFDPAADRVSQFDDQYTTNNAMSNGAIAFAAVSATAYDMANASPRPMVAIVTATGGGNGAIRLPRANTIKDSDIRYIMNDPASTQTVLIRNGSLNNTIYTLAVGDAAICLADNINDKWLIIPAAGSYGT